MHLARAGSRQHPSIPDEPSFNPAIGGKRCVSRVDRAIAALAERQHGVVGRAQLLELGIGSRAVEHRLVTGRLQRLHRSVYAVGHRALSREGRWMAAVLAGGHGAVLSHRSAAALWDLRPTTRTLIEITAPQRRRLKTGIETHHANLPADETTKTRGIPVTIVPRTLLDLAAVLPGDRVERAINEAEVRRLADALSLPALLARYPRRRGVAVVRAILEDRDIGSTITRSELEERFLALLARSRVPRPEVNASLRVAGAWIEVDCLWRAERLVVELDGRAFHEVATAYERDRTRDRALSVAGWRVIRVTWRQLQRDESGLAADLRSLLAQRAATMPPPGGRPVGNPRSAARRSLA